MKKYVVFVYGCNTNINEVSDYCPQNNHLNKFMNKVVFNGEQHNVLTWGDNMYKFKNINPFIKANGNLYQVIDLVKFGNKYVIQTKKYGSEEVETLFESKSYLSYEECYNDMKIDAMNNLCGFVDIEQDFEFGQGDRYCAKVTFYENQISIIDDDNTIYQFNLI